LGELLFEFFELCDGGGDGGRILLVEAGFGHGGVELFALGLDRFDLGRDRFEFLLFFEREFWLGRFGGGGCCGREWLIGGGGLVGGGGGLR
jgi:hypothetical protein